MKKLSVVVAFLLAGCATNVTSDLVAAADAGPMPNSQEFITQMLSRTLVDPDSVKALSVGEATKCGKRTASYQPVYGWCITYQYNAKNRMGGYTGLSSHEVMVRDGKAIWEDGVFTEFHF